MDRLEKAWQRILKHEGEIFETKEGCRLVYKVEDDIVRVYRLIEEAELKHKNFGKVLEAFGSLEDLTKVSQINVTGPSYTYAILKDPRINPDG